MKMVWARKMFSEYCALSVELSQDRLSAVHTIRPRNRPTARANLHTLHQCPFFRQGGDLYRNRQRNESGPQRFLFAEIREMEGIAKAKAEKESSQTHFTLASL